MLKLTVTVVKCGDDVSGFVVLPRRWVVERTFGWIIRYRRCVRDYERLPVQHETMVYIVMIMLMSRRLAQRPPSRQRRNLDARTEGAVSDADPIR